MKDSLKILLCLTMITLTLNVSAQFNLRKGYIITNANDTVYGKIDDRGIVRNSKACHFKTDHSKKIVKYLPTDIKSYSIDNEKLYKSIIVFPFEEQNYTFSEVLIQGKVNLFYEWKNKEIRYYIQKENDRIKPLPIIKFKQKPENRYGATGYYYRGAMDAIIIPFYQDTLLSVFNDNEPVSKLIDQTEYNAKALVKITKKYLRQICPGNDCITFENDSKKNKVRIGVFTTFRYNQAYYFTEDYYGNIVKRESPVFYNFPIGALLNYPIRSISDRLSLQVEFMAANMKYNLDIHSYRNALITSKTISFPISLKYEIPMGNFFPSISIGKTASFVLDSHIAENIFLHHTQKETFFYDIGLAYKLSKKISIFSSVRIQSYRNLIVDELTREFSYSKALENRREDVGEFETETLSLIFGLRF